MSMDDIRSEALGEDSSKSLEDGVKVDQIANFRNREWTITGPISGDTLGEAFISLLLHTPGLFKL